MAEVLEGKIAKILDERNVIITLGMQHSVKEGMRFVVFAQGEMVTDPDTGESLGAWEIVKGYIAAAHVQEQMTICAPSAPPGEETAPTADPSTKTLSAAMIRDHMRAGASDGGKLDVNQAQVSGMPQVGPISVGDHVRCVTEEG